MILLQSLLTIVLCLLANLAQGDIILLLSNDRPPIANVAETIRHLYPGKVDVFNLHDDINLSAPVANLIEDHHFDQVVAIGLLAAQVARRYISTKQVIFCQVLNYQEYDLITPNMKGVSALAPTARQFQVWREINPRLRRVGVITSHSMLPIVAEAQESAQKFGIELVHEVVKSDREASLALSRMINVQGLWLVPDSSILSIEAIARIMMSAIKEDLQVLGFSPVLLAQGALLSGIPDEIDIAQRVIGRLQQAKGQSTIPGLPVAPLIKVQLTINPKAANKFGIVISDQAKEILNYDD